MYCNKSVVCLVAATATGSSLVLTFVVVVVVVVVVRICSDVFVNCFDHD